MEKSGLNLRIVEMAIVEFNPKSFRNRNPNFLFADQNLYLPSLNEMKNLVLENPWKNFNRIKRITLVLTSIFLWVRRC